MRKQDNNDKERIIFPEEKALDRFLAARQRADALVSWEDCLEDCDESHRGPAYEAAVQRVNGLRKAFNEETILSNPVSNKNTPIGQH